MCKCFYVHVKSQAAGFCFCGPCMKTCELCVVAPLPGSLTLQPVFELDLTTSQWPSHSSSAVIPNWNREQSHKHDQETHQHQSPAFVAMETRPHSLPRHGNLLPKDLSEQSVFLPQMTVVIVTNSGLFWCLNLPEKPEGVSIIQLKLKD